MKQRTANLLAFLAAPLVPAILMALGGLALMHRLPSMLLGMSIVAGLTFYVWGLVFTIVLALPAFLLMPHARRSAARTVATGTAIGLVVGCLLPLSPAAGAIIGAGEALLFWLVWRCGDAARSDATRRP